MEISLPLPRGNRNRATYASVGLSFMTFALGIYRLGAQSLSFDEGFSYWVARMSIGDALRYLSMWDAHPPLHYLLLNCWMRLAGSGEFALRLPSVAAAVLLIPLIYQTGRTLATPTLGLLSALTLAPSAFLVFYAQQARMYTLGPTVGLLATCLTLRTIRRAGQGPWYEWLGLALALAAGLYTVYYTAFLFVFLATVVIVVAWCSGREDNNLRRLLVPYGIVAAVVALLFLPWCPSFLAQASLTGPGAWRTFVPAVDMLVRTWKALSVGPTGSTDLQPQLWLLVGGSALLALVGLKRRSAQPVQSPPTLCAPRSSAPISSAVGMLARWANRQQQWLFAAGYVLIPLALIYLASYRQPIFHERYVTLFLPAFALLVGLGLLVLRSYGWAPLAVGLLLALVTQANSLSNFYFDQRYAWGDFRGLGQYLQANLLPGDVVVLSSGASYPIFKYYFQESEAWRGPIQTYPGPPAQPGPIVLQIGTISNVPGLRLSTPEDFPQTPQEVERRLGQVAATTRRIWYLRIFETVTDSRQVVHSWLENHLLETDMHWFKGLDYLQLYLYDTRRPPAYDLPPSARPAAASFANGINIVGYEITPMEPGTNGLEKLTLYWQTKQAVSIDYQLFAHLVDYNLKSWVQHDGSPLLGHYPTSRWQPGEIVRDEFAVRLPADLPTGVYHFLVGMYDRTTLERVPLSGSTGIDGDLVGELVIPPPTASGTEAAPLATFGQTVALQDFQATPVVPAGGNLDLTVRWRAISDPGINYKVFVHLLDANGTLIAQTDQEPLGGRFPTGKWRAGEVIEDHYIVHLPATIKQGAYTLAVGFYDPISGNRLPTWSGDGRILLPGPAVAD